jgi:hypothetical protein
MLSETRTLQACLSVGLLLAILASQAPFLIIQI